ncbi:ABC transporter ATP-binding protein [Metamycoplasma hominis]|uniref:ATP-binding cassette domain-containing protein n=1 Tax=Metamycoplasma hominis TaxID=2098 RepID=UPI001589F8C5|nr:ABC transporter ATP-binding protein [Metamycoplasma hominis]QKX39245.1 AAA family ATPase [Metamycoplasma hominis]
MIKSLKIKNNNETYDINLNNQVNVIVGEKGSGKSTLLLILAEAIVNKKLFKNEYEWFNEKAKFLVDSINIDNTEIKTQDFSYIFDSENKQNSKDAGILEIQKNLSGYISQNDSRKNSLDSSEYVEKQKSNCIDNFTEKIYYDQDQKMLKQLDDFKLLEDLLNEYRRERDRQIALSNVFNQSFNLNEGSTKNIATIDYDSSNEIKKIKELLKSIEETREKINSTNLVVNNLLAQFEQSSSLLQISNEQLLDIQQRTENVILQNNSFLEYYNQYNLVVSKDKKTLECFKLSFTNAKRAYLEELSNTLKIQNDNEQLLEHFSNLGRIMKKINRQYNSIIEKEIILNWTLEETDKKNKNIKYKIESFALSEEEKNLILNKWLGSTNKSNTIADVFNGNIKDNFDIKKMIKALIKDKIKIYAGDEEYKNLSMGQKTLFGITHAIDTLNNVPNEQYLLLDQIEDNLDNKTIYEKIVPMLQEQIKKDKQIFIVTHNPNIGTLIKGNIITTDIFNTNLNKKFVVNEIIREDNEIDTPQSLYLEGSMKALYERLKVHEEKINKTKGDK